MPNGRNFRPSGESWSKEHFALYVKSVPAHTVDVPGGRRSSPWASGRRVALLLPRPPRPAVLCAHQAAGLVSLHPHKTSSSGSPSIGRWSTGIRSERKPNRSSTLRLTTLAGAARDTGPPCTAALARAGPACHALTANDAAGTCGSGRARGPGVTRRRQAGAGTAHRAAGASSAAAGAHTAEEPPESTARTAGLAVPLPAPHRHQGPGANPRRYRPRSIAPPLPAHDFLGTRPGRLAGGRDGSVARAPESPRKSAHSGLVAVA